MKIVSVEYFNKSSNNWSYAWYDLERSIRQVTYYVTKSATEVTAENSSKKIFLVFCLLDTLVPTLWV